MKKKNKIEKRTHLLQDILVVFLFTFTTGVATAFADATQEATQGGVSPQESSMEAETTATTTPPEVENEEVDMHVCGLESVECEHEHPYYVQKVIVDAAMKYNVSPKMMLDIAYCESRYKIDAVGDQDLGLPHPSYGIFQINPTWHNVTKDQLFDPVFSATWAAEKMANGGVKIWSCAKILGYVK